MSGFRFVHLITIMLQDDDEHVRTKGGVFVVSTHIESAHRKRKVSLYWQHEDESNTQRIKIWSSYNWIYDSSSMHSVAICNLLRSSHSMCLDIWVPMK